MKRILVVEDNAMNARLIVDILESLGFAPLEAKNGVSGLQTAQAEHPDLILLDILLPDMNGIEVLKHLKDAEDTRQIPVIALTASANSEIYKQCMDAGCDAFMTKPFTKRALAETLARFMPAG